MRLPHAALATVPRAKVVDYLLAADHPEGGPKARFFRAHGFDPGAWERLAEALLVHGRTHDARPEPSPFGTRYVVEGPLGTPGGRRPYIRTVWFVEREEPAPRFVTAYPVRTR